MFADQRFWNDFVAHVICYLKCRVVLNLRARALRFILFLPAYNWFYIHFETISQTPILSSQPSKLSLSVTFSLTDRIIFMGWPDGRQGIAKERRLR